MADQEPKLIIWNTKKLAKKFNIERTKMARILKALGARKYTNSTYILEVEPEA